MPAQENPAIEPTYGFQESAAKVVGDAINSALDPCLVVRDPHPA